MRKIYIVTLENEDTHSIIDSSIVKGIAYFLYQEIDKFDREILCTNEFNYEGLIKNELYETDLGNKYIYKFISEKEINKDYYYLFDPFMISNNSFAFTTYSESIEEQEISYLLDYILKLIEKKYKYQIEYIYYDEKIADSRYDTISLLTKRKKDIVKKR